jgi:hypothetical protein
MWTSLHKNGNRKIVDRLPPGVTLVFDNGDVQVYDCTDWTQPDTLPSRMFQLTLPNVVDQLVVVRTAYFPSRLGSVERPSLDSLLECVATVVRGKIRHAARMRNSSVRTKKKLAKKTNRTAPLLNAATGPNVQEDKEEEEEGKEEADLDEELEGDKGHDADVQVEHEVEHEVDLEVCEECEESSVEELDEEALDSEEEEVMDSEEDERDGLRGDESLRSEEEECADGDGEGEEDDEANDEEEEDEEDEEDDEEDDEDEDEDEDEEEEEEEEDDDDTQGLDKDDDDMDGCGGGLDCDEGDDD